VAVTVMPLIRVIVTGAIGGAVGPSGEAAALGIGISRASISAPMSSVPESRAQPIPSGAHGGNKGVTLCFRVGGLRNYCIYSTFDPGAYNIEFLAAVKLPLKQTRCGERAKNGTPFEMRSQDDTVLADFDAGEVANWNVISSHMPKGRPRVNTGLTFYNRDEVLFDAANGRVGLRKLATPGETARSRCGEDDGEGGKP
jgi:hypothetical protein